MRKFIFYATPNKFNRYTNSEYLDFSEELSNKEIRDCFMDWIGDGSGYFEEVKEESND